jgi:hypothetical protein
LHNLDERDLEEIRSRNLSSDLDPTKFFRDELASAIREIRNDSETAIENHRQNLDVQFSALVQRSTISRPEVDDPHFEQTILLREKLLAIKDSNEQYQYKIQTITNMIKDTQQRIVEFEQRGRNNATRYVNKQMIDVFHFNLSFRYRCTK